MSEAKSTHENETNQEPSSNEQIETKQKRGQIKYYIVEGPSVREINAYDLAKNIRELSSIGIAKPYNPEKLLINSNVFSGEDAIKLLIDAQNKRLHSKSSETEGERWYGLAKEFTNFKVEIIPLSIDVKPLTPQTLAYTFTALTELTTKLWLIAHHRFADLIEFTQTHDVRFANEAGSTIAWVTYNSPFSFGLQVDKVVPGIADAIVTIVDGLSQRKAKQDKLELDNLLALMANKAAEEHLKQQQAITELEREKREIELEKLRLENQKERQALTEQRLESQFKQIEYALELTGKAVDIVDPNADPEIRPVLIQSLVNNILQLDSMEGLQLFLPEQSSAKSPIQDDAKQ